jgi:hypothetical protein
MFLSKALQMSEPAQIILAIAVLFGSLKGIIWVIRCPKDSPHYKLPSARLSVWPPDKER